MPEGKLGYFGSAAAELCLESATVGYCCIVSNCYTYCVVNHRQAQGVEDILGKQATLLPSSPGMG